MGEVYRGVDTVLDRTVAIKILLPQFARDANFVDRFRREAQAAARLNHPNLVGIYDSGADGETQFIVMEFIEGRTLEDFMSSGRPLRRRARRRGRGEDLRGARVRPRRRRDPPRHQAGQRHGHPPGRGQGHGLRHRPDRRRAADGAADIGRARHRRVHLPGTGAGPTGRRPERHLFARRRALRDVDRTAAVHRRLPRGRGVQAGERVTGAPLDREPRGHTGARRGTDARAREEPREPLPDRRRVPCGPGARAAGAGRARHTAHAGRRGRHAGDQPPAGNGHPSAPGIAAGQRPEGVAGCVDRHHRGRRPRGRRVSPGSGPARQQGRHHDAGPRPHRDRVPAGPSDPGAGERQPEGPRRSPR